MRKAFTVYELIGAILGLAILVGWVMNIIAVVNLALANSEFTTMFILRIVGIFVAPLGGVLGFV